VKIGPAGRASRPPSKGRRTPLKRRHHTPEQVNHRFREADRLLVEGKEIPEVCKHLEISEATYHRWQAQYSGMRSASRAG